MILSKEFYERCSPIYKKVIDELEQKIADIKFYSDSFAELKQIYFAIMEFSRSYLTPIEYWNECIRAVDISHAEGEREKFFHEIAVRAYFHCNKDWFSFLFHDRHQYQQESHKYGQIKLLDFKDYDWVFQYASVFKEGCIGYPHSHLKQCFRLFELQTSRPPSNELIQRYEKMKALYLKIKASEHDYNQWLKLMFEADDIQFVKDNVELRLGKDYFDVKLWKLYLDYLKEHCEYKLLLETYSKYCRFFSDDLEMLEKYKEDMIQYGPNNVQWDNLFEWEMKEEGEAEKDESKSVEKNENLPLDLKRLCDTFYDTYHVHNFSLPGPIIVYILKNASHQVLRKLFSSCKYFFAQQPTPICYLLATDSESNENRFCDDSITLTGSSYHDALLKNTYITGSIMFGDEDNNIFPNDLMSRIISRLYRCNAKYIELFHQHISFKELKFLIQHGGVVHLFTDGSQMLDENGDYVELEAIMEYLPNIEYLRLDDVKVGPNTAHFLTKQNFTGKICNFVLCSIHGEPFDPIEFRQFFITNRDDDEICVIMDFCKEFDVAFVENFDEIMNDFQLLYEDETDCFVLIEKKRV